jgi:hypothetical protein
MALWYYAKGARQAGPVSEADLKLLAETGVLLPTDFVWKQGESKRRPAATLKNLFPKAPKRRTLLERIHPAPLMVREESPQVKEAPDRRSGPTFIGVASFLVAMLSIVLGGGASYLYWTNTQRPLVLPTALLGLLLGNLVLLVDWLRDRARFSVSILGVTLSTVSLTTAFVDVGGLSKARDDVRQALTGVAKSEPSPTVGIPNAGSAETHPDEPKPPAAPTPSIRSATMTKQDLIAKIEALGNPCKRSDLVAEVGKPHQEQVKEGQLAGLSWIWQCSDGKVEVVLLNPDVGSGEHTDKSLAYISKINEQ